MITIDSKENKKSGSTIIIIIIIIITFIIEALVIWYLFQNSTEYNITLSLINVKYLYWWKFSLKKQ